MGLFAVTWSSQIGLGTGVIVAVLTVMGAVGLIRSSGAKAWRQNAEAEKARADRLTEEKAELVLEKAKLEGEWTKRQADANTAHVEELRSLTERIHSLEVEIAELRARPTVDDLARAIKGVEAGMASLHEDVTSQTDVLTEIRDSMAPRRRASARTRTTDSTTP